MPPSSTICLSTPTYAAGDSASPSERNCTTHSSIMGSRLFLGSSVDRGVADHRGSTAIGLTGRSIAMRFMVWELLPLVGDAKMSAEITDEALGFLLARAGLDLTEAQKAELKTVYPGIVEMAARVRKPRG